MIPKNVPTEASDDVSQLTKRIRATGHSDGGVEVRLQVDTSIETSSGESVRDIHPIESKSSPSLSDISEPQAVSPVLSDTSHSLLNSFRESNSGITMSNGSLTRVPSSSHDFKQDEFISKPSFSSLSALPSGDNSLSFSNVKIRKVLSSSLSGTSLSGPSLTSPPSLHNTNSSTGLGLDSTLARLSSINGNGTLMTPLQSLKTAHTASATTPNSRIQLFNTSNGNSNHALVDSKIFTFNSPMNNANALLSLKSALLSPQSQDVLTPNHSNVSMTSGNTPRSAALLNYRLKGVPQSPSHTQSQGNPYLNNITPALIGDNAKLFNQIPTNNGEGGANVELDKLLASSSALLSTANTNNQNNLNQNSSLSQTTGSNVTNPLLVSSHQHQHQHTHNLQLYSNLHTQQQQNNQSLAALMQASMSQQGTSFQFGMGKNLYSNPNTPLKPELTHVNSLPLASQTNSGNTASSANNANNIPPTVAEGRKCRQCNCKNSACLKLYCECFASSLYCEGCNCRNCQNRPGPEFETKRNDAIAAILERNPQAFQPKISVTSDTSTPAVTTVATAAANAADKMHLRGCHCRKSHCQKRYCECFEAGVACTANCKCTDCYNVVKPGQGGQGGQGHNHGYSHGITTPAPVHTYTHTQVQALQPSQQQQQLGQMITSLPLHTNKNNELATHDITSQLSQIHSSSLFNVQTPQSNKHPLTATLSIPNTLSSPSPGVFQGKHLSDLYQMNSPPHTHSHPGNTLLNHNGLNLMVANNIMGGGLGSLSTSHSFTASKIMSPKKTLFSPFPVDSTDK